MSDMRSIDEMLEAIKTGIMTEIKGQQLYSHAATQTEDPSAKSMFETLAWETPSLAAISTARA